ncbi:hypothetical protein QFZ31_003849 [Neobacillus niacini]|nr:hypothetical protein [Neobacillus niacini]
MSSSHPIKDESSLAERTICPQATLLWTNPSGRAYDLSSSHPIMDESSLAERTICPQATLLWTNPSGRAYDLSSSHPIMDESSWQSVRFVLKPPYYGQILPAERTICPQATLLWTNPSWQNVRFVLKPPYYGQILPAKPTICPQATLFRTNPLGGVCALALKYNLQHIIVKKLPRKTPFLDNLNS